MGHEPVLISTIAIGLSLAFVGGLIARRLRLPTIVGYLAAGVLIGPFTPGFVADPAVARELAEIGIILLMFGVGIRFAIADLLAVRGIAIPGALVQMTIAALLGTLLGVSFGWGLGGGLVLGLAISVASTVVMVRALTERGELESLQGRVAVGWLIVQDLLTVLVLVLLPTVAPLLGGTPNAIASPLAPMGEILLALGKAALFGALMFVVGKRAVPWLLGYVARQGSRELFSLAVLAVALGIAYVSSEVFGVSFALGAFLAGAVVAESDMSHQAAADALPLRDAFAVLFFVSVGMLVDPFYLLQEPFAVLAVVAIITVATPLVAFLAVILQGHPPRVGSAVGAGLAQIGEFSFILATLGQALGLLPPAGFQLVVAGALVTITLNPLVFRVLDPVAKRISEHGRMAAMLQRRGAGLRRLESVAGREVVRAHAIVCGYGRVGRLIGSALERRGFPYVVITEDRREVERLRSEGSLALYGDAANPELLRQAQIGTARVMIVAIPDPNVAQLVVERAREANPRLALVVRTHSERQATYLRGVEGSVQGVHAELELAVQMTRYAMRRFGVSMAEAEAIAQGLRGRGGT